MASTKKKWFDQKKIEVEQEKVVQSVSPHITPRLLSK
jgi:hypothetical protein